MHERTNAFSLGLRLALACLLGCALTFGAACADDDLDLDEDFDGADGFDDPVGFFTTEWTVAGSTDPGACEELGANSVLVSVFDDDFFVSSARVPCDQFDASLGLIADDYTAEALLLDENGEIISDSILIDRFTIEDGMETVVEIGFDQDDLL